MGFISRLFGRSELRSVPAVPDTVGMFTAGGYNDSGVIVNETNAVTCSAVWACVQIISQALACLPAHVLGRKTAEKRYEHPVARLLASDPNEYQTAAAFRECLMANALLWGGGYAFIEKDDAGVPTALLPLRAAVTKPVRVNGGQLMFGTLVGGRVEYLPPDRVFYVPGLSLDGITALNPINNARQTVGLSIALERFAAKLFSNGGNVGGVLKVPPMKEDALKNFVASWRANYQGLEQAFRVAVLPDGFDFKQTTIDPDKGQMTASRQHQVLEVARFYRVPPHMLGIMDKASYASIEQTNLEFYQNTVQPWVVKFEQEADRKLLLEAERPELEIKLNMDAMLRASTQERYTAYQTGRQAGFLSVNDIRRKENLPPVDGGDTLLQPLNMASVGTPNPAPAPPPPPPAPDTTAARGLIEDAVRRLLVKEGKALTRAAKRYAGKPAELRQWADTFYRSHEPLVRRVTAAPLRAAGVATTADDYARTHCAESVRAVAAAVEGGAAVEDLTDEWADIRPAEIAEQLTGGSTNGT